MSAQEAKKIWLDFWSIAGRQEIRIEGADGVRDCRAVCIGKDGAVVAYELMDKVVEGDVIIIHSVRHEVLSSIEKYLDEFIVWVIQVRRVES